MPNLANFSGMAKVTVEGRLHGQLTNNVFFFGAPGELGNPDWPTLLNNLAVAILQCITTTLLPALSIEFTVERIRLQLISPALGEEIIYATGLPDAGELAESLPSTVAAVFSVRTGQGGRSKRGRFYIAGVPEAGQALSVANAGELALLVAFATCMVQKFITDANIGGWRLGVYSRKLGGTKPMNMAAGWTPATNIVTQSILGTMRSRKIGRGA